MGLLDRGASAGLDRPEADAWAAWLRTFRWVWWATPSFHDPTAPATARRLVRAWLEPLPRAYAAVALPYGPLGDRLHVHALVGGVSRNLITETLLRGSWRHGNIALVRYSPLRGAAEYLCRRQHVEIELLGTPVIYRPPK
jgi:hypothetical protein